MSAQWTVPAWAVVTTATLAVLALLVAGVALRSARRTARCLVTAHPAEDDAARPAGAASAPTREPTREPVAPPAAAEHPSYVITRFGDETEVEPPPAAATLPPGAFTEAVLRESAIRSASLLHGVRRALAPPVRDRIRGEMRREVKRQRKARRAQARVALREWQARQRADEAA